VVCLPRRQPVFDPQTGQTIKLMVVNLVAKLVCVCVCVVCLLCVHQMYGKLYATRRRGRPKMRWLDDVSTDLRKIGINEWGHRVLVLV